MLSLTHPERESAIAVLRRAIEIITALPAEQINRPCGQCHHFDGGNCKQWNTAVPEEAQAAGCDAWVDIIPF